MAPTRMEWDIERRIGIAGDGRCEVGGRRQPGRIDAEVVEPAVKAGVKYHLRALAYGGRGQQGKRSLGGIVMHGINISPMNGRPN